MKSKTFIPLLIIVSSIAGNFYLFRKTQNSEFAVKELKLRLKTAELEMGAAEMKLINIARLDQVRIDLSTPILMGEDSTTLFDVIKEQTLVYRFSYSDCTECVNSQLELITQFKKMRPNIPVIILMTPSSIRDYKIRSQQLNESISLCSVTDQFLIKEQSFFLIDRTGITRNYFLPESHKDHLTMSYLNELKIKF